MLSVLNPVIESVTQQNLTYTQSADLICSTFETLNTLGAQEKKILQCDVLVMNDGNQAEVKHN